MRLGIFLPNWIGDVVMATPALRALKKLVGSDGKLVGIMRPYVADVLAGTTWLDDQIIYQKPSRPWAVASAQTLRELRAAKLDRVVLLTNSIRTAWMAWRSGAAERIGNQGAIRAWLLTQRIDGPLVDSGGQPVPTIDGYLRLAEAAGAARDSYRLELAATAADELAADEVWRQLKLPPGKRVIVLNSGGAFGAAKQWPVEHFAELARRIVAGGEYSVLVNCGPAERAVAREIAMCAADPRIVTPADRAELPIGLAKACIRRARMLVTTDSGPRYFGIAFNRPVITLFGPTDPARTKTYYEQEKCLSLGLECQPCMARTCPLSHHRCMRDLSVEIVYREVAALLQTAPSDCAA
jgi:heptosyltransferase-2